MNDNYVKPPEQPQEFVPFGPYARFGYGCAVFFLGSLSLLILGILIFQLISRTITIENALLTFVFALGVSVWPIGMARNSSKRRTERIVVDSQTVTLISRGKPKIQEPYCNVAKLSVIRGKYGEVAGYMVRFLSEKQFYFDKDIDHVKELTTLLEERTGKQFPS